MTTSQSGRAVGKSPASKAGNIELNRGQARFWHNVTIAGNRFGPVHLALGKPHGVKETWLIVSDQPTDVATFDEYGLRFDIEENFLDDKSNGFQLESSLLRSADALNRLCIVILHDLCPYWHKI